MLVLHFTDPNSEWDATEIAMSEWLFCKYLEELRKYSEYETYALTFSRHTGNILTLCHPDKTSMWVEIPDTETATIADIISRTSAHHEIPDSPIAYATLGNVTQDVIYSLWIYDINTLKEYMVERISNGCGLDIVFNGPYYVTINSTEGNAVASFSITREAFFNSLFLDTIRYLDKFTIR